VRPAVLVSGGGWNLSLVGVRTTVAVAVWQWGAYLGPDALAAGVRANVSSYTRHHPNVMMTKAKIAGNYANSALAKTESVRLGFDEAIMLDPQGFVSECTGENLFLVRKGTVYTTPRATILEGVTRDTLLTIARDLGYATAEQVVTRDQLYMADELFVCGTAAEVIGLREVDGRPIGAGVCGPVTRALQAAFHDAVRGKTPRYAGWLAPVPQVGAAPAGAQVAVPAEAR
jgi:branched-chain amino acid aminotransferase